MRTGLLRRAVETDLRSQLQQSFEELVTLLSTKKIENGIESLEDQRLVEAFQRNTRCGINSKMQNVSSLGRYLVVLALGSQLALCNANRISLISA